MKRIFSLLIFFSSLFVNNQTFAQNDYVVTLNGDTLKGKIKKAFLGGMKFKENGKSDNIDLNINNFKEYFTVKDSIYNLALGVGKKKEPEFLERLENGKIELFKYMVTSGGGMMRPGGGMSVGTTITTWYARKDGGDLLEIKTDGLLSGSRVEREKNFDFLIGSYAELLEDFKKEKSFSFDILRAYIKKYNYYYKYLVKN